ncbi:MAG TPA: hypothetical protein VL948_03670 [Verrucomicrobiae bacterium]|jgi:hypothetical protein|nr:hypothetical protein [Verrucomicrobiae bacterium]
MIRPSSLALAVLLLLPLAPSRAHAVICGLFEPPVHCNARKVAESQAQWQRAAEEQQNLTRLRLEVSEKIGNARARFWATYPDKPGAEEARLDFAHWLWTKDIIYLRQNLQSPVFKDETGRSSSSGAMKALETMFSVPIDDGIPQAATPEFEAWVNAVRKKVFEGHTSNSTDDAFMQGFLSAWMGPSFWKAVASADKQYQAYLMARDWWEFDHAHRVPAGYESPDAYGALLYSRWHKLPMAQAVASYRTFAGLVGSDAARAAAKAVHDAPKDAQGLLVVTAKPPVKIGPGGSQVPDYDMPMPDAVIGTWASPVTAMEILATRGNARTYLLFLLREQNENGTRIDRATQWTFAETAYNRLKLAFGDAAILDAAERVRTAKKRMTSNTIVDQQAIGATRNAPTEALQDILARKDPAGYVKCALIFSGQLDSPAAADSAYRQFLADHGEANVLAAAKRLAAAKPYFFYRGERDRLEKEMLHATAPDAAPAATATADSPQYLAWRDFAPGATATYLELKPGATEPTPSNVLDRQTYRLRSISDTNAQVWVTQIVYDPTGKSHPPRDSEEVYPAKTPATPSPAKTGAETLTIKGQTLVTHWEQTQQSQSRGCTVTRTIWTSDEVPGGVVRSRTDTVCGPRTMVQDRWLESYAGTRTRPAAARPAAAAPSAPPLASVDPAAPRVPPRSSAMAAMDDQQIVQSQLSGIQLELVTVESIDLTQVKAGRAVRAKVNVQPQLRFLQAADAERLNAVMNDVDVQLRLTVTGLVLSQPRLAATVDSVSFRGQDMTVATNDFPQIMRVKPEFAHTVVRGAIPDAWWELPANTAMIFRPREGSARAGGSSAPSPAPARGGARRR